MWLLGIASKPRKADTKGIVEDTCRYGSVKPLQYCKITPQLSRLANKEQIMSACSFESDLNETEYLFVSLLYVRLKRQVLLISVDFMIVGGEF